MWAAVRKHPVITAVMVGATVAGAVAALWLAPEQWAVWRKIGAGATTGAFVAFTIVATRMVGAFGVSEDDERTRVRRRRDDDG